VAGSLDDWCRSTLGPWTPSFQYWAFINSDGVDPQFIDIQALVVLGIRNCRF
ncbi:uncharacterized protein METZ01_LOCUS113387, partial [marine metagenome]